MKKIDFHFYMFSFVSVLIQRLPFLQRSSTCKQYDLDKIPCEHAIKAAKCWKIVETTLVDHVYTKGYLVEAYT